MPSFVYFGILVIILFFIFGFLMAPIISATAKMQQKREVKSKVYDVLIEFAHEIEYLAEKSEHSDRFVNSVDILNLLQEKIRKIEKA